MILIVGCVFGFFVGMVVGFSLGVMLTKEEEKE